MGAAGQRGRRASPGLAVTMGRGVVPAAADEVLDDGAGVGGGQATPTWLGLTALGAGKAARAAKIWHLPDVAAAGLRRVWYLTAILVRLSPGRSSYQRDLAGTRR